MSEFDCRRPFPAQNELSFGAREAARVAFQGLLTALRNHPDAEVLPSYETPGRVESRRRFTSRQGDLVMLFTTELDRPDPRDGGDRLQSVEVNVLAADETLDTSWLYWLAMDGVVRRFDIPDIDQLLDGDPSGGADESSAERAAREAAVWQLQTDRDVFDEAWGNNNRPVAADEIVDQARALGIPLSN